LCATKGLVQVGQYRSLGKEKTMMLVRGVFQAKYGKGGDLV